MTDVRKAAEALDDASMALDVALMKITYTSSPEHQTVSEARGKVVLRGFALRAALAAETKPDLGKCAGCGEEITDYDGVVAYTEGTFCNRACAEAAAERAAETPTPDPTGAADVELAGDEASWALNSTDVWARIDGAGRVELEQALVSYADAHAKDAVAAERERGFSAGILDERGRWEAGCPEPAPTTDDKRCEHGIRWPHPCDDCFDALPDKCPDCGKPWHEHTPEDNCGATPPTTEKP